MNLVLTLQAKRLSGLVTNEFLSKNSLANVEVLGRCSSNGGASPSNGVLVLL